ncbi:hypothetical protein BDR03DRAFT_1018321 [Suillus americanus]|nr:hypothetical protein BDR03DRAFT_1018321 [Suillus americanus]
MSVDSSPTLVSSSLPASPILWPADDDGGEFYDHDYDTPLEILTYCPLIKAVKRFLLRLTFIDNMQDAAVDKDRHPLTDDELMQDIYDGTEWLRQEIGLKRVVEQDGSIIDEATPGSRCSLFSCEVGVSMTINIDWFGITDNRPHSAGAVYISFDNLHRAVRYLTLDVHLAMVIHGPKEPSLEQLNYCFKLLCTELHTIYKGLAMRVYRFRLPQQVHGWGHSHKKHPCNHCVILLTDLDTDIGYHIGNFRLRNDVARTELGDDHSLPKADQWRRLSSILPVVLWVCWKDQHGWIKKVAPTVPANAKTQPKFKGNLPAIYNLVLYMSVAKCILASKAISVNDVDGGQRYLQLYCQGLHKIGAHQTINNHLAMHYSLIFQRFGPSYEHFNGALENVNLNGHGGGEMGALSRGNGRESIVSMSL